MLDTTSLVSNVTTKTQRACSTELSTRQCSDVVDCCLVVSCRIVSRIIALS